MSTADIEYWNNEVIKVLIICTRPISDKSLCFHMLIIYFALSFLSPKFLFSYNSLS